MSESLSNCINFIQCV